jgi:hypothetical protein
VSERADEQQRPDGTSSGWPPPHPSPPLPPPRAYRSPGGPPDRRPLLAAVVGGVLAVLVVVGGVWALSGGDDDPEPAAAPSPTAAPEVAVTPTQEPTEAPIEEPTETPSEAPPAAYTCWNAAPTADLAACPPLDGAAGLAWLYPAMATARCGQPAAAGGPGVVARVLCRYRAADGTVVRLGYFQWDAPTSALAFYDGQGLARTDGPDQLVWNGAAGAESKLAYAYAAAPYSVSMTYPVGTVLSPEDQAALAPRPAAELLGVAAQ